MRLLVLNIGNSSVLGGLYRGERLVRRFRFPSADFKTAAGFTRHLGPLLKQPLQGIALCSVVPRLTAPLLRRLEQATGLKPALLDARASHGLRIAYRDPSRLGTDRLAAALGARALYPGRNIVTIDCGTATTVTALDREGVIQGGAIFPGLSLWSQALARGTAQLPAVKPGKPRSPLGRSPEEAIASGLYHGHAGALKELSNLIAAKAFGGSDFLILGTGGLASVYRREKLFTRLEPDLILTGLRRFAALRFHAQDLSQSQNSSRDRHLR